MAIARNTSAFWGETWNLAMQALRANRMRAILTMLGVVIGSASIVLVVTIALTGKRYALAQIEGVGANLVYANVINSGEPGSTNLSDQITPADLEAVKVGLSQLVTNVAGTNSQQLTVSMNGQERPINLVGVTPGYEPIHNLAIVRGRYFDESDLAARSKVCLITEDLARRVFPFEDPDGKQISAGELHFTVIGVFESASPSWARRKLPKTRPSYPSLCCVITRAPIILRRSTPKPSGQTMCRPSHSR